MDKLLDFISEHLSDDTTRLILDKSKWPEIDMETAVNCIESRRKLKGKVQEWYDEPRLIFPLKLSAEQCSSSSTGIYKAQLAARIAGKPVLRIFLLYFIDKFLTYIKNLDNISAKHIMHVRI